MSWNYLVSPKKVSEVIRASAVLTTSYVALTPIDFDGYKTLILNCEFTKGSSTGFRIKIEKSDDDKVYVQEQEKTQAGGISSYSDNEHEKLVSGLTATPEIPISPIEANFVRVSVMATGGDATGTLLKITAIKSSLEY
jgi:hypothetical protein